MGGNRGMGKEIVKGPGQTEGQITGGKTGREVHLRVGMSVNVCVCEGASSTGDSQETGLTSGMEEGYQTLTSIRVEGRLASANESELTP